jgi:hypothetical protein
VSILKLRLATNNLMTAYGPLRVILQRRAISVANGGIAEIDRQPSIEEGDAFDPTRTLALAHE